MYLIVDLPALPILYTDVTLSADAGTLDAGRCFPPLFDALRTAGLHGTAAPMTSTLSRGKGDARLRAAVGHRGFLDGKGEGRAPAFSSARRSPLPDGVAAGERPAMRAAHRVQRGPFEALEEAHTRLLDAVERDGHDIGGPAWLAYLTDPAATARDRHETAIYVPLAR